MSHIPELLCPAGNMEKLAAAVGYGADAVYLAGTDFGMRAAADNFSAAELKQAAYFLHSRGKKLYIAVNIIPREHEYAALREYLDFLAGIKPDALIVAAPGVLSEAKLRVPHAELHISTQAGVMSAADCRFWHSMGAKRVVLAREINAAEIREIKKNVPSELELEVFIHGAMCVSVSGRCLLSAHLTGAEKDANAGRCTQPCRWNWGRYEIIEEKRPNSPMPVEEDFRGTYIMSSRDMCTIEHIHEIAALGVASVKIEGRMKSAYYAAVTANAYRIALDGYARKGEDYVYDPRLRTELDSVSHREYCSGYYFDEVTKNPQIVPSNPNGTQTSYLREKAYLAVATAYADGRAYFVQRNKVTAGASAELITPGAFGRPLIIEDMRDEQGVPIESAPHPLMKFSIAAPFEIKPGDILRGK